MADKLIHGPCSSNLPASPTTKPSGSHVVNGEPGYKKREGGRFPEVVRDTGARLEKPTRK
jgi:hypothetical protein